MRTRVAISNVAVRPAQVQAFSHFSEIHPSSFYVVDDGHPVDEDEVGKGSIGDVCVSWPTP